ncbi:fimbrial biogenesis chaperone [Glacieibacterium megasporae]|uniref:fimbrial biogenesis chaperone n=1 Tax=Glacieibacterium megasporae TaxID=2835787 RepID=UPI001C1DEFAD|nr:fimbria/pilus periplasmic chaperone [Polymorphobacter megasporae]UAJ10466.1 fimbria/pilus periplasmic chaperone [Polymorphobacter megasporae]
MIEVKVYRRVYLLAIVTLSVSKFTGEANAQSLQVSPVTVAMLPDKRSAALEITNTSALPVDIQVRPYDWQQVDGRDELIDSATLRVSPSIVEIAANTTQTIRVLAPTGLRTSESCWRLIVDQLPQPSAGSGLQIRLRMSVPVFAYSTKVAAGDIRWRIIGGKLEGTNYGRRHARLDELSVKEPNGAAVPLSLDGRPYLLPGTSRRWDLAIAPVPGLTVVGRDGVAAFSAQIALESVR